MPSRVTIRDVAAKAGLHFTTVSLALRNSPRLKEQTRLQIQELALQMGYRPDPMLAALNAYRHGRSTPNYQATIGWINNWPKREDMFRIPEFREYFEGARERAEERGYLVDEFWLHEPGVNPEKLQRILRARNIGALLLAPQAESQSYPAFRYHEFAAVALGYSMRPAIFHVVSNHHFHTITLLLGKVRELGYRRIGLCISPGWDDKVENAWAAGLMLWYSKNPHFAQLPLYAGDSTSTDPGQCKELDCWIRKEKPDVIVSHNGLLRKLDALGYKVPEQFGFASLTVRSDAADISGAHQSNQLIGKKAVDLLIDMLHRGETGVPEIPIRTLVESVWRPGKTLCQQAAKKRSAIKSRGRRSPE